MWQYNPTELYHYGVLGMKWGVRRDKTNSGQNFSKRTLRSNDKKYAKLVGKQQKIWYKMDDEYNSTQTISKKKHKMLIRELVKNY